MIYISTSHSKQSREDHHIYSNGAATYLQMTVVNGEGNSANFRCVLPKCLPVKYLRAVRDQAQRIIGENALKWDLRDVAKLQLTARNSLKKIADEYLESQRMEKLAGKYCEPEK